MRTKKEKPRKAAVQYSSHKFNATAKVLPTLRHSTANVLNAFPKKQAASNVLDLSAIPLDTLTLLFRGMRAMLPNMPAQAILFLLIACNISIASASMLYGCSEKDLQGQFLEMCKVLAANLVDLPVLVDVALLNVPMINGTEVINEFFVPSCEYEITCSNRLGSQSFTMIRSDLPGSGAFNLFYDGSKLCERVCSLGPLLKCEENRWYEYCAKPR